MVLNAEAPSPPLKESIEKRGSKNENVTTLKLKVSKLDCERQGSSQIQVLLKATKIEQKFLEKLQ